MVPQLANMGTVESGQEKANCAPLSMGPQVFHTTHWWQASRPNTTSRYHRTPYTRSSGESWLLGGS